MLPCLLALVPLASKTPSGGTPTDGVLSAARRRLLDLVHEEPGITISDLSARLGVGWGAFYHHLHQLEAAGLLQTRPEGRRCLVYPPGQRPAAHPHARSLLRSPTARSLALAILRQPRCTVQQLVASQSRSERVVYYHVRRLVDAGLVTTPGGARLRDLVGTPQLEQLLTETARPGRSPHRPTRRPKEHP